MEQLDLIVKLIEQGNEANEKGHKAINTRLDVLNHGQHKNTNFRISTQAIVGLLKWGIPIMGLTGIVNLFHMVSPIQ